MEEERQVQDEREAHSLREKEEQLRQMEVREGLVYFTLHKSLIFSLEIHNVILIIIIILISHLQPRKHRLISYTMLKSSTDG